MILTPACIRGWQGFEMACGDVSLGIVPRVGGRIMSLGFRGEELLYAPKPGEVVLPALEAVEDLAAFKRALAFPIFGGDKTWVAPERAWLEGAPPVDLDAGTYTCQEQEDACVMTSPVCRETGLQIIRRIAFLSGGVDGDIALVETLRNMSDRPAGRSVWNVTQVQKPFDVYLPVVPGGLRSYHHDNASLPDPGFCPEEKDGWARIPCRHDVCFKFGGILREGHAVVMKETPRGTVVFTRLFEIAPGAPYAHQSMAEVFNSPRYPYGEMEVHAPLALIPPGGEVSLTQLWRLCAA